MLAEPEHKLKMPTLNAYQQKAQDQHLGSSGKFGKHQQSPPLISNSDSDFQVDEDSESFSNESSPKEVDHLLPLYEVFRSLDKQGDVNKRVKKVRIIYFCSNSRLRNENPRQSLTDGLYTLVTQPEHYAGDERNRGN